MNEEIGSIAEPEGSAAENANEPPAGWPAKLDEFLNVTKLIWPNMLITAVISVAATFGISRFTGNHTGIGASSKMVVFDVIKYSNAQRKLAAQLVSQDAGGDAAVILRDVNTRTLAALQDVARKVAGDNATILVRQSVLSAPTAYDITDRVLSDLGLPTDAPTALSAITEPVTNATMDPGMVAARESQRVANDRAREVDAIEARRKAATSKMAGTEVLP